MAEPTLLYARITVLGNPPTCHPLDYRFDSTELLIRFNVPANYGKDIRAFMKQVQDTYEFQRNARLAEKMGRKAAEDRQINAYGLQFDFQNRMELEEMPEFNVRYYPYHAAILENGADDFGENLKTIHHAFEALMRIHSGFRFRIASMICRYIQRREEAANKSKVEAVAYFYGKKRCLEGRL